MRQEILTKEQLELLPVIKSFSKDFGLVGGTAIALYLGHRRSVDFDLFGHKKFKNQSILKMVSKFAGVEKIMVNKLDELTLLAKGVKMTFFLYPYKIAYSNKLEGANIKLPDLLSLAAMKAFALGMRAKWKDYVDLYFIIKAHFSASEIAKKGGQIFGNEFNEKIFRSQLAYFQDIDYSERVKFMPGFKVSEKAVKESLRDFSLRE